MQQVADWLEKLGLGQYAQRFAAAKIFMPLPSASAAAERDHYSNPVPA
jgi:hypothetical protein